MKEDIKNFMELLKNFQGMQVNVEKFQSFIENLKVTGDAGAGMVQVIMNGKGYVLDVKINKAMFDSEDTKMLEDLIVAAFNDAQKKLSQTVVEHSSQFSSLGAKNLIDILQKGGKPSV